MNTSIDRMTKAAFKDDSRMQSFDFDAMRIGYEKPALFSLGMFPGMVRGISDLHMHLVCADSNQTFITSDSPVFKYNQYLERIKGMGITGVALRGIQIFVPLSPKHLLMLYDTTIYKVDTRKATVTSGIPDSDVASLNSLQVHSAEKNIYFNDWAWEPYVTAIVGKSIKRRIKDPVQVDEFFAEGDPMRSLLSEYERTPNLGLNLSFVKVQKRRRQIPLPDRVGSDFRFRSDPSGIAQPPPNGPPIPDGTVFVRRSRGS
jgi:hypothetical protein